MKNNDIADIFLRTADLLEIKGDENPFRIRAYRRAADSLAGLKEDARAMSKEQLLGIPGIGADLANKIEEIARTGSLEVYRDIAKSLPEGLPALLSIPSLGPKTVKLLHQKLHVRDIADLEALAREGKLAGLPGIKKKTEENILKGIATIRKGLERMPLGMALPLAQEIVESIKNSVPLDAIYIAGSLRRRRETAKHIVILAASSHPDKIMQAFTDMPNIAEVIAMSQTKTSVMLTEGIQADLHVIEPTSLGAALLYLTGSKAHNIRLSEMAQQMGLKINEQGVLEQEGGKRLGAETEQDIYQALGLPLIPPELREDKGEIVAAKQGTLPRLVTLSDIKGDLHAHTMETDGSHDLPELIEAAQARGYTYLAITDHSKGLAIANGLSEERLLNQIKRIDALNKKLSSFRLLKGIEVDIKGDGSLDFPDDILSRLDIVVASIHSGFKQPREKLMMRLVSAMENQLVHVIAHPTGRLIGQRDAYDVDMEEVIKVASATGTALEINAHPLRLDLTDVYARRAKELGVGVVISTDTHTIGNMDFMDYGVSVARRGWLEKGDVLNTMEVEEVLGRLRKG